MNKKLLTVNNNIMTNEEYDELINKIIKKDNILKNMIIAFISGGFIGIIGQLINDVLINNGYSINDSSFITFCIFIIIGSLLTGFGIFDKVLSICKCGLIVPSTGFANTMTSSAMDTRSEGFIKGIGSSIFKLTGSIILYGIIFGVIFGYIRSMII